MPTICSTCGGDAQAACHAVQRIEVTAAPPPAAPPGRTDEERESDFREWAGFGGAGWDPAPSQPEATACRDFSPPWFTGRWRDWHRGHGCDKDDGQPRTPEGAAEIARGGRR